MNKLQRKNLMKLAGIKPKPLLVKTKMFFNVLYENVIIIYAVIYIVFILSYNFLVREIFKKYDWQIELK